MESEIEVIIITVGYFQCTGSFYITKQKSLYLQETFMYYCCCFSGSVMSNSLEIPQTIAPQAPLSTGFPRQEYWSGLLFPAPGDLSDPGIQWVSPASPAQQADSLSLSHQRSPTRPQTPNHAVEVRNLNHWIAREVPWGFLNSKNIHSRRECE